MESLLKSDAPAKDERNELVQEEPTRNLPQFLAATAASLILMIAGTNLGWTSPVLPKLMAENSSIPVTSDESTWIGSLVAIGAILGPFPAGVAADLIGTKRALLFTALPYVASWAVLAVAKGVPLIYAGRVLAGLANGWGMTLLPMYIGEIATAAERGALGVIGQILITSGFLYVYILGPILSYVWLNVFCSFIPMAFFIFFYFMPESPYYELKKNNYERAGKCLAKLRGKTVQGVKEELNTLRVRNPIHMRMNPFQCDNLTNNIYVRQVAVEESNQNVGSWAEVFSVRGNRRAVGIMFGLMAVQQFSGINCVLFYSENIFKKAGSSLSPDLATVVVGFVMFLASFPTPYLIEQLGRRMVLILSAIGMTIFQAIIGGFFYMETLSYQTSKIAWLPLASIIGYISLYSLGIGPVPWAMIGEMFASNIRSKGASMTASFSWLLAFFMTKSFGLIVEVMGSHWAFWLFAAFCALGVTFIYFCLPETKGKTLEEIQDMLNE
ncbi:hypothetical protein RUM44_011834 [Polyplax serrata]|uniref:Major facilitator superfamily (MFS) profile domain-containing protein n=1 Tax=Polyplax serrata TaxID=468196 RepID=A0ABR1BEJ0_POLSC